MITIFEVTALVEKYAERESEKLFRHFHMMGWNLDVEAKKDIRATIALAFADGRVSKAKET